MKEITKIYVELLGEGVPVWRPVDAIQQGNSIFLICEQEIPEDECWKFLPGETVVVEEQIKDGQQILVAVELAKLYHSS
ncbi:MAG: hypothetical protein SFU99_20370 [Saprospiraceae bacterium]|nr:hypothetical protein [Saprospiraceae bacterium]